MKEYNNCEHVIMLLRSLCSIVAIFSQYEHLDISTLQISSRKPTIILPERTELALTRHLVTNGIFLRIKINTGVNVFRNAVTDERISGGKSNANRFGIFGRSAEYQIPIDGAPQPGVRRSPARSRKCYHYSCSLRSLVMLTTQPSSINNRSNSDVSGARPARAMRPVRTLITCVGYICLRRRVFEAIHSVLHNYFF